MPLDKDFYNTGIYYPDILDPSTMLSDTLRNCSYYKDAIHSFDEDITYRTKVILGVNKVIELANLFNCVYLDKIEFLFIIREMYVRFPKICLDLLNDGRICFINCDKNLMFYDLRDGQSYIQIHCIPKISDEDLAGEFSKIGNCLLDQAVQITISKAIKSKTINPEIVTKSYLDDLKRGYYQGLGIGINSIIGVNQDNKELYDLIAQLMLDLYICDLYGIKTIYLKEFFYWADKYKRLFKNGIFKKRTRFGKELISNYTSILASKENTHYTNSDLRIESNKSKKEMVFSFFGDEYRFLKTAFSSDIKTDYENKGIIFIKNSGESIELPFLSFDNYLKELQSKGQALRQTRLFIKITPKKHLDSFLAGDIKFSKPITFIDETTCKGRGDKTEATFISEIQGGKRVCLRNIYDLNYTYIWCCFGLDNYMFVDSIKDGKSVKKAIVKKEYYTGFFDDEHYEENIIIFIKPDEFVERLCSSLVNKGIAQEDILISPITYIRKYEDHFLSCEPPYELFYKDTSFLHQNEIRVLIRNSGNKYDYLFNEYGVINIGDIRDICTIINGIYHKDMECILVSESRMEFTLP